MSTSTNARAAGWELAVAWIAVVVGAVLLLFGAGIALPDLVDRTDPYDGFASALGLMIGVAGLPLLTAGIGYLRSGRRAWLIALALAAVVTVTAIAFLGL